MVDKKQRTSKMLPVGLVLIGAGILLPILITKYAWSTEFEGESTLGLLLIFSVVLVILVPIGLVLAIIGVIRKKRARKQGAA